MMRLLKFTLFAISVGADTCSNNDNDGECADVTSALQIKDAKTPGNSTHFSQEYTSSAPYPEPSKKCGSLAAKAYFNGIQAAANAAMTQVTKHLGFLGHTFSFSFMVWKNWITKCETDAKVSVTGAVVGLNTTSLSEFKCIETNTLNTKYQVQLQMEIDSLEFVGTGLWEMARAKENGTQCMIGDGLIPKVEATIGATFEKITVTALVNMSNLVPTDISDIEFRIAKITDFKCGALTKPVNLNLLNEICSAFLTPVANLAKKPVTLLINKVLNKAANSLFNDEDESVASETLLELRKVQPTP